jgi:hypothetical protein
VNTSWYIEERVAKAEYLRRRGAEVERWKNAGAALVLISLVTIGIGLILAY